MALGSPSDYTIKQKMLFLPQQQGKIKHKFLILDLEEVLLHIVQEGMPYQVELQAKYHKIRLNLHPFCQMFLNLMNQHYQIYIFTTASEEFANPIVKYFNSKFKIIQGFLTQEHCLQTRSGLLIKDICIIKNRDLSQIVIVDSMAHSFGLQIENGIPILAYRSHKYDRYLLGLQKLLLQLKILHDVRQFLGRRLNLKIAVKFQNTNLPKFLKEIPGVQSIRPQYSDLDDLLIYFQKLSQNAQFSNKRNGFLYFIIQSYLQKLGKGSL